MSSTHFHKAVVAAQHFELCVCCVLIDEMKSLCLGCWQGWCSVTPSWRLIKTWDTHNTHKHMHMCSGCIVCIRQMKYCGYVALCQNIIAHVALCNLLVVQHVNEYLHKVVFDRLCNSSILKAETNAAVVYSPLSFHSFFSLFNLSPSVWGDSAQWLVQPAELVTSSAAMELHHILDCHHL